MSANPDRRFVCRSPFNAVDRQHMDIAPHTFAGLAVAKFFAYRGAMGTRPRLADVARAAHVSVSTASKALNNTDRVSAETQRAVRAAADRLGYRTPREGATRRSRSGLVGLITSDHNGRFALPLLVGAETTLGASSHAALLMSSHGKPALERSHINQLAAHGVDGLIVVGDTTNPRPPLPPSAITGLPVVYAYDPSTDPTDCNVVCDNLGAGRQAIEYLIGIGRKHIAVVGGADTFQASRDRSSGALESFQLYGLAPVEIWSDRWSEEWGEQAATLLARRHPELDAVYCLSDEIARGMARGLAMSGRDVPRDVAVVGHDNWDVFSTNAHPTLTTFDNNIPLLGKTAAQLLLDAIHGREHHGTAMIECPMVIRESSDPSRRTPVRGTGWVTGLEDR